MTRSLRRHLGGSAEAVDGAVRLSALWPVWRPHGPDAL